MTMETILQYLANGLVTGSTYVLVALGLAIVFSTLNVVNFAHGEMYMLGGYVAYVAVVGLNVPFLLAIPLAGIIIGLLGLGIERAVFRPLYKRPHIDMILVSVGLIQALQYLAIWIWGIDGRDVPSGLGGQVVLPGGVSLSAERVLVIVVSAILIPAVALLLKKTMFGRALHAIADDEEGAETVGINRNRFGSIGFIIGASLAGIAGALIAPIALASPLAGAVVVIKAFIILILGGMGSVRGAIIAGLGLGIAESVIGGLVGYRFVDAAAFALVIITLLFRPSGLFGRATRPV